VNSYYSVIETIPVKACVRVSSTAGLSLTTKVMIIQMKGAAITTYPIRVIAGIHNPWKFLIPLGE
jgi:hypothetical protein